MRNFFDWWVGQLADTIPGHHLRSAAWLGNFSVLEVGHQRLRLFVGIQGELSYAAEAGANAKGVQELAASILARPEVPNAIVFRPAPAAVLHKRLSLPLAARHDLGDILKFEIDRETPFAESEVYWTYSAAPAAGSDGKLDVELLMVQKSLLDPLLDAACAAGLKPAAIELQGEAGGSQRIRLTGGEPARWFGTDPGMRRLAALAAGLAVLALVMPFLLQQVALAAADRAVARWEDSAKEAIHLRQSIDRYARATRYVREQRKRNGSALAVLAAATDTLPDNTYLASFSLHAGKLTMTGQSESAAALIGLLSRAPAFRDPAFEAPVVQNQETDRESFTISASLRPVSAP